MPQRLYTFGKPTNPVLQVVYFLLGAIMLIGALLVGAVILSISIGVAAVLGLIVFIRVWWLNRKFERAGGSSGRGGRDYLEVEYTVVDESDDKPRRGR